LSGSNVAEVINAVSTILDDAGLSFGHGTDNAWDEATLLVLSVTGLADHTDSLQIPVAPGQLQKINALLERRIQERLPLPYLLGRVRYAGLEFLIEPGVVIPRSPIAELLGHSLQPWLLEPPERIVDLCCGSGCIGIAAALEFPDSELTLVDIDDQATALAARNVAQHGLADRTRIVTGDLWAALPAGRFDLILSNPPYVDAADMSVLPAEYRHEPALGLAAGVDGLDVLRRILDELPQRLTSHGILVCEVGNSAAALQRAYPQTGFIWPELESGGEGVFVLLADAA
jgi:ribosomal protein L3 glutamine methyltransferase